MESKRGPESLVVLVPGFLGFSRIGPIGYFGAVEEPLLARLRRHGVRARLFVARPDPAGGLRTRTETLLDQVASEIERAPARTIHFVGHSAGGLDVRLAFDPRFPVRDRLLPPARRREARRRMRERLGARITIGSPHRGTPFAVPFALVGPGALESKLPLTARLVLRLVRLGIKPDSEVKRWLASLGFSRPWLDSLAKDMGFHRAPVEDVRRAIEFVLSVVEDRDAIGDLTPAALRRAARGNPRLGADDPHCWSILTFAPPPRVVQSLADGDLRSLTPQAIAYAILWGLTAHSPCIRDWPPISPSTWRRLAPAGSPPPGVKTSDGIIPTLSQPWGRIAGIFRTDHQGIIGMPGLLGSEARLGRRDLSRVVSLLASLIARAEKSD